MREQRVIAVNKRSFYALQVKNLANNLEVTIVPQLKLDSHLTYT